MSKHLIAKQSDDYPPLADSDDETIETVESFEQDRDNHVKKIVVFCVAMVVVLIIIVIVVLAATGQFSSNTNTNEHYVAMTERSDRPGSMNDLMSNHTFTYPLPAPDIPMVDSKLGIEHLQSKEHFRPTKLHRIKYKEDKLEHYAMENKQYDDTPDSGSEESDSEDSMVEKEGENRELFEPNPRILRGNDFKGPMNIQVLNNGIERPWAHMGGMNPFQY